MAALLANVTAVHGGDAKKPRTDLHGDLLPPGAVSRIGTVRWWYGSNMVTPLIYAPDGKSLVFRDDKGIVHFLDAATGRELRHLGLPADGGAAFLAAGGATRPKSPSS